MVPGAERAVRPPRRAHNPAHDGLETQARLVLRPDFHAGLRVGGLHLRYRGGELFLKAACSSGLAALR